MRRIKRNLTLCGALNVFLLCHNPDKVIVYSKMGLQQGRSQVFKIFKKIEDKFRKNCVNIAEALSDFREK